MKLNQLLLVVVLLSLSTCIKNSKDDNPLNKKDSINDNKTRGYEYVERKLLENSKINEPLAMSTIIRDYIIFDKNDKYIKQFIRVFNSDSIVEKEFLALITNPKFHESPRNEKKLDNTSNMSWGTRDFFRNSFCNGNSICIKLNAIKSLVNHDGLSIEFIINNTSNYDIKIEDLGIDIYLSPFYHIAGFGFNNFKNNICKSKGSITNTLFIHKKYFLNQIKIPMLHDKILNNLNQYCEFDVSRFETSRL